MSACLVLFMGRVHQLPLIVVNCHTCTDRLWVDSAVVSKLLQLYETQIEKWESSALQRLSFFAGSFATDVFEDVGHSTDARELMKDFYIGDLAEVIS